MKIVLVNPEIPQNTGNIARLSAGLGVELILAGKRGFSLEDRYLKRAGLDYWEHVKLKCIDAISELETLINSTENTAFISKFGRKLYTDIPVPDSGETLLIFGNETGGLPSVFHEKYKHFMYRIPMSGKIRSLNIANSVAVVAYDYFRRNGFHSLL
ncbi:MAG: tRNA (cytidine(34)-2'-O)-methyltransferase [Flexistipes sinusarabici]|uniref:Putative tRNA (cytidine(34)-2'-O)-methyltransferase n=1 Tax=Flexistipes sinusarabici TaxID=2352 RepID=A0A5D0MQ42_FLESI|nr:TrmH family RNA methyltransferase [Flexistipes sinusarabici]TYB33478.1 MAG: tRNA (cytidine(34)-2'-O)-methyltransferase [Flexistipes sinusarabici]